MIVISHRDPIINWLNEHKAELPKGDVLEFGCGAEFDFRTFFELHGLKWQGLTKGTGDPVNNIGGGLIENRVPFVEDDFDLVFSSHAFEHCEDPVQALRNCHQYLKPNGKLIIATPIPAKDQILEGSDADHIFVLNEWQMQKLFQFVGFKDVKTYRTGEHSRNDSVITVGLK